MSGGWRVGDRLSLAILGLCCGGTFIALTLTSVAKRQGQTGPPPKPDYPWLHKGGGSSGSGGPLSFDERLRQLDSGGGGCATGQQQWPSASGGGNGGGSAGISATARGSGGSAAAR